MESVSSRHAWSVTPADLQKFGPRIDVSIWNPNQSQNKIDGTALIDTGATITFIKNSVVEELKLKQEKPAQICQPGDAAPQQGGFYIVGLLIPSLDLHCKDWPVACPSNLPTSEDFCVIGRDILSACEFVYNGVTGQLLLRYIQASSGA